MLKAINNQIWHIKSCVGKLSVIAFLINSGKSKYSSTYKFYL